VTVTTPQPHGLVSGQTISVNIISNNLVSAFVLSTNLTGRKSVIVISPTSFTLASNGLANATVTGTLSFSDSKQDLLKVTLNVPTTVFPQGGDAIKLGNLLFKTRNIKRFSGNLYLADLLDKYTGFSNSATFLNQGYLSRIKLNPLTAGNVGVLKYISEFQASFRNQSSCSQLTVNFSSDSTPSATPTFWNSNVGSSGLPISFSGWGQPPWGVFPWGGGTGALKEFNTTSAVILRIYVPKECFVGTYIQPIITHDVAGEGIEIQSMSLFTQLVSIRTSR
jgi:hypothetical protein